MIKHYFKIALRNLGRQKILSFINISGLSIGIACFTLFLLYTVNEFSYDRFHKNADNIYRVYRWTEAMQGEPPEGDGHLPMPLGPAMKADLPDVADYVRMMEGWSESFVRVNNNISRERVSYADPQLFSVFSFSFVSGNSATALSGLSNIILTEGKARQLFGNRDPAGQSLEIKIGDQFETFIVGGVIKNFPSNSSIRFELLANFDFLQTTSFGKRSVDNWMRSAYTTFVQLKPESKLAQQPDRLLQFRRKYYPTEEEEARKAGY